MFRKVLVANRGEIAIRAFRAAYELGAGTVAVFPYEDRNSVHRLKADEAYEIGEPGHPVRAYLASRRSSRAARRAGADAVYPGYGFLSENPDLARPCEEAGITFIGPSAEVLELTGNKARAVAAARAAGVPVLRVVGAVGRRGRRWSAAAEELGLPGVRQGRRRRWWSRYAAGTDPAELRGVDRGRDARGRVGFRRPHGVPGEGGRRPPAHRGADPRRRRGTMSSTCSSGTARCSDGTRR